jgi:hypothetical protein
VIETLNGDTPNDACCKAIATLGDILEDLEARDLKTFGKQAPIIYNAFEKKDNPPKN